MTRGADLGWRVPLAVALSLVAPGVVAATIGQYGLNLPIQDQWRFAPEIVASWNGRYDPSTVWVPFGPHRIVFPKIVMLLLAGLTRWDTRAEMWFDFAVVGLAVLLLADLARVTVRRRAPLGWVWVVPLASTSLFTLGAWHGWTLGWMMNLYLAVLGGCVSAWGLGRFGPTPTGALVCVGGGVLAAYSYLGAMPLLVLGPTAMALLAWPGRGVRAPVAAGVLAATFVGLYFVGYPTRATAGSLSGGGPSPLVILDWVVKYLGSRFAVWDATVAFGWGLVALAIGLLGLAGLRSDRDRAALVPWLLLLAYVAAGGVLTAAGRQTGPNAPLLSRFAMFPALYWAAVPPVLVLGAHACGWERLGTRTRALAGVVAVVALVVAGWGYVGNARMGLAKTHQRWQRLSLGGDCLERVPDADLACLRLLSRASPRLVQRMGGRLADLGLGPFSDQSGAR